MTWYYTVFQRSGRVSHYTGGSSLVVIIGDLCLINIPTECAQRTSSNLSTSLTSTILHLSRPLSHHPVFLPTYHAYLNVKGYRRICPMDSIASDPWWLFYVQWRVQISTPNSCRVAQFWIIDAWSDLFRSQYMFLPIRYKLKLCGQSSQYWRTIFIEMCWLLSTFQHLTSHHIYWNISYLVYLYKWLKLVIMLKRIICYFSKKKATAIR